MTGYVAEKSEAREIICHADLYEGWSTGDLLQWFDDLVIIVAEPKQDGQNWVLQVAPAKEVGREAGTA